MAGTINITSGGGAVAYIKSHYNHDTSWTGGAATSATTRRTINSPNEVEVKIDTVGLKLATQTTLDLNTAGSWDTVSGTDYTTAANRAGKDFYIYMCQPVSGTVPVIKLSANSTVPSGYSASTSRKVGGFHCLCVAVGTISGHTLTGYLAGDILPLSVWDLWHRAESGNEGMVYAPGISAWVDIYLTTGSITVPTSVNNATILNAITQYAFVDTLALVNKRLLFDHEFTYIATGSNEATNITASADPVTTSGHSDTAGRRMISNIGCEDCAGVLWQWLNDSLTPVQGVDYATGVAFGWKDVTGTRGQVYSQGTYGFMKLVAGGAWDYGARCGSRARNLYHWAWLAHTSIGSRALSNKRI